VNLLHNNNSWLGARTMRWPLQQISNCQTATRGTFTYDNLRRTGQRVHVPVENATRTMFWGQLDNPTTFRIFSWDDFRIKEWVWPVNSTEFNNPDCRGGVGHFDWIEGSPSWSITGFRMRGATTEKSELPYGPYGTVLFLWPAAPDLLHHQAHLHGAVFDADSLQFVAETRVFSNSFCYGYPALGANSFGEYALSVAFGGDRTANSGTSAQSGVTVSRGWPAYDFPTAQRTAGGTHNRTDERFGDYFTVRKNERCPNTWNATNYALSGGNTLPAHVDARYVEFQSRTTPPCPL